MWFKNIQLFEFKKPEHFNKKNLTAALKKLSFTPCPLKITATSGWVSPTNDEYAPIFHEANDYILLCLQTEAKVLPATVVNQKVIEQVKEIEKNQMRKLSLKEKYATKDNIYQEMLPQAFTQKSKIYAYIDLNNNWLILNTTSAKKTELFLNMLKNSLADVVIEPPKFKQISKLMTRWMIDDTYPDSLSLETSCVLQDPHDLGRVIRFQKQDLKVKTIQGLIKDGYDIVQLSLSWQGQINFTLKKDGSLRSLKYEDQLLKIAQEDTTSEEDSSAADFLIMTDYLTKMLVNLYAVFQR